MRDAMLSGLLAFVAVLVLAAAFRPPGPPEATPTPVSILPPIKCGIPEADCQKLASAFIAQAQAAYPGKTVSTVVVMNYDSFEICFSDGLCYDSSGGGPGGVPGGLPIPPVQVATPAPPSS